MQLLNSLAALTIFTATTFAVPAPNPIAVSAPTLVTVAAASPSCGKFYLNDGPGCIRECSNLGARCQREFGCGITCHRCVC
ncbi:hypothetical protein B0J11DRAFT_535052 [Dendryphion nanum]|uniref:Defensin n=1 Tax=Dendryphion nanum TaxID=256645 RepID=A0A9P9IHS5_9PLEO|nr:hypothetical protein B0J11DRAFT_535052 [Dendryphion nanum]